jgi:hypothetical protein
MSTTMRKLNYHIAILDQWNSIFQSLRINRNILIWITDDMYDDTVRAYLVCVRAHIQFQKNFFLASFHSCITWSGFRVTSWSEFRISSHRIVQYNLTSNTLLAKKFTDSKILSEFNTIKRVQIKVANNTLAIESHMIQMSNVKAHPPIFRF